jgi:hypothetical protein
VSFWDFAILALVALAIILAWLHVRKKSKNGGCVGCSECANCSSCAGCARAQNCEQAKKE